MKSVLAVTAVLTLAAAGNAQAPPAADRSRPAESHYYDRWPGLWHRVEDGRVDSLPTFTVRHGPGNSFLEDWHQVIDGNREHSFALRSWDPETSTWRLVWVSDPDYFQVWDGLRLEDGWYIVRRFGEGTNAFLSRQAWILQGPDRLYRTIERSTDGGNTWTFRYREHYQRVPQ